jgi:hypothetical protein
MIVTLFIITFIFFAIACMLSVYFDLKIQQSIFINHPKLWKSFGFPSGFHWLVPATEESEYNKAGFQLDDFLKSPKCESLGDEELRKLIVFFKLIQKIALVTFICMVIVGGITFLA